MLSRRRFLEFGFLTVGIAIFIDKKVVGAVSFSESVKVLYNDLFPGIDTQSSYNYLKNIILNHSKITKIEKDFIRNGIQWLNKEAISLHNKAYPMLTKQQREDVLEHFSKSQRGEEWLFIMMGYMFESILADPVYGTNADNLYWKWLNFKAGIPRPKKAYL